MGTDVLGDQLARADTEPALVALWQVWQWSVPGLTTGHLLLLARSFERYHRIDLALQVAEMAHQRAPDDWEVCRLLGWLYRQNGQAEPAIQYLTLGLSFNQGDIEALGMLAGIYKRKGGEFLAEAERLYRQAVQIDPRSLYHWVNLGALAVVQGVEPSAYHKVLELTQGAMETLSTWSLLARAEALVVLGQGEMGLETYQRALGRPDFSPKMAHSAAEQLVLLRAHKLASAWAPRALAVLRAAAEPRDDVFIVHISDPHWGRAKDGTSTHRFEPKGSGLYGAGSLDQSLKPVLAWIRRDHPGAAVRLVISGDISYRGEPEEFARAQNAIIALAEGLGLTRDQVTMVPGNHDVCWDAPDDATRFDPYLDFVRGFYGESFGELYPHLPTMISRHADPGQQVILVGLNSCVLENKNRHFGVIGEAQLAALENCLKDKDDWLKVVVLHHHVLPLERDFVEDAEGEPRLDATLVRDYALLETHFHRLGVHLVLHGHKHEPGIRESRLVTAEEGPTQPIVICAAGSVGVEKKALRHGQGNHFAVYRVMGGIRRAGEPFLEIYWYELAAEANARWKKRGPWSLKG